MPVLGAATLELNADTAKLEADLGRTVAQATAWGTAIGHVLGDAITAAARKLEAMVSKAIETADAADKMTQKLGVSAEWFSTTAAAAELANVSVASLSQGMKMLAVNAQATTGKSAEAFRAMGIDAKSFGDDTQGLFDAVMAKLASYEDSANKVALANAVMGRSGAELIPMANELEKNRKLAEELGVTMDANTNAAAARFKDNMKAAELASGAMGMKIMEVLLPAMEKLSGFLVENAKNSDRLDNAVRVAEAGLKLVMTAGTLAAVVFNVLGGAIASTARSLIEFGSGNFTEAIRQSVVGTVDVINKLRTAGQDLGGIWEESGGRIAAKSEETSKQIAAPALLAAEKVKTAKQVFDEFAKSVNAQYQEILSGIEADAEIARRRTAAYQAQASAAEALARAQVALSRGELTEDWDITPKAKEAAQEVKKLDENANRFGLTMASAFEKAITGGAKFRDIMRGLGQDILQMIIRITVTERLARSIAAGIGPTGGGAPIMWWGSSQSAAVPSNITEISPMATGGPAISGQPYLIGEKGPELFVPDTAGTIVPNDGLGGVTIVNNINVAPGGVSRAEVEHALARSSRATVAATMEALKR